MEDSEYQEMYNYLNADGSENEENLRTFTNKFQKYRFRVKSRNFTIINDRLYYREENDKGIYSEPLYIVKTSEKEEILEKYHSDPLAAHLGINKTYDLLIFLKVAIALVIYQNKYQRID